MSEALQSFSIGTLGLLVVLIISAVLALSRATPKIVQFASIRQILVTAICFHLVHLAEETVYGFHVLFPQLLGLAPWPVSVFLAFNFGWVLIWLGGVYIFPLTRITMTTFWFLGIASAMNGIAHPTLSFVVNGYFPGLVTSPVVGLLGILIIRRLYQTSSFARTFTTAP